MAPSNGKKRKVAKSERADLQLSVSRTQSNLRKGRYADRISTTSAVYLTAVLEYVTAELLELSGAAAHQNQRRRIAPRHVQLAISSDPELNELLKDVQIPGGGVLPFIHPALLKVKTKNTEVPTDTEDSTAEDDPNVTQVYYS